MSNWCHSVLPVRGKPCRWTPPPSAFCSWIWGAAQVRPGQVAAVQAGVSAGPRSAAELSGYCRTRLEGGSSGPTASAERGRCSSPRRTAHLCSPGNNLRYSTWGRSGKPDGHVNVTVKLHLQVWPSTPQNSLLFVMSISFEMVVGHDSNELSMIYLLICCQQ